MSKFPIIAKGDVMFPNFEHSDNYCLFVDIVKGKDTFRVYNVHLQSIKLQQQDYELFGEKNKQASSKKSTIRLLFEKLTIAYPARADQAKMVVEHMNTSPYPIIVCGDFNDTPMSYVYNQFNNKLIDAFRATSSGIGKTYAGKVPAGRIDYVFHTDELSCSNFMVHKVNYSDHRPITCSINFSKP
jgi:endonuclease/exonuclease/phosphatase family metal-dependent hydrolase